MVNTSEVVFSSPGAGEYELSNREVIGFGGTASYDSTLNGKVLDLAIRDAVNNLVAGMFFIDGITRYICISNTIAGHLKTHSPQPSHNSGTSVGG
ncbi:curli production assembly/transport component CsgG [Yersinia similis]|uniref:Curli production assembly/transport component CsgG n=1 Tax=Yersinia similis TaxID=367190 RepID=A0A0T9QYJ3_9GAMM|nr:curli production assembly/transport component CsgG [Yersinia similis]CNE59648.1 curli production assembly/transport component CsgG [Yersinia similis]CNG19735.1 curli production assembly/transport component CsgG [Yersinia similis]CNI34449.1 curli production assembly/transport component CsgG [Yersinia similis]